MVDATAEEEVCTDAQLLVSINERGNTCSVQKLGKSGLHPDLLFEMMQVGLKPANDWKNTLVGALH